MKAKWLFSIIAVIVLLAALSPSVAFAATDTSTGQFECGNSAPTITSVTLQENTKTSSVDAMTPLTAFVVEVVAGDANTIDDIKQIDFWIFRDAGAGDDGVPGGAWDCDEEAIYKWVKSGDVWSMENGGATTTWSITDGSCDTPDPMTPTSGEWNLYFTVGKIAWEADGSADEWDVKVTVTDNADATASSTIYSKSMGAYSELAVSDETIDFGSIGLGNTSAIQTPVDHNIVLAALSNDTFALASHTTSTWTTGSVTAVLAEDGAPDAANEFAITLDDADGGSGHPDTPQAMTTGATTITGHGTDARSATTDGNSEATSDTTIYMDCELASDGIQPGTYTGTITFTITNS